MRCCPVMRQVPDCCACWPARGGHAEDVFDVAWAPDASALLSGSIENVCIIWDAERARGQSRLADHSHYVQGVAWDPARKFLVSQSADRTCR